MCNKKCFLLVGGLIVGLCNSTMQAWPWTSELEALKYKAIQDYVREFELDKAIKHGKKTLLKQYASLNEPHRYSDDLRQIERSISGLQDAVAKIAVRMERSRVLRQDFINRINRAQSIAEIEAVQDNYRDLTYVVYEEAAQKVRDTLVPSVLLDEFGLSNLGEVRIFSDNELEKKFKEREPKSNPITPYDQLTPWEKIKNYFFGGPSSSNFGFTQVPPRVQTRPYSFGIPQPMRDRFQMLKEQARAFPTRQMTPQEQMQEQESRFYNRRTIPNPENVFVAPY
jgi:hypothetical protein